MNNKKLVKVSVADIKPYPKNEKVHTNENLDLIRLSLETVGYVTPIVVDEDFVILAGHGRYVVMQEDKFKEMFPEFDVIVLSGLTNVQKNKFRLFDNQSSRTGHYDNELLIGTIKDIMDEDTSFNISSLGIDGLADAFSTEVFSFDLGKVTLEEVEKKTVRRVVLIVTDDLNEVTEVLNKNGIDYILGYESTK